VQSFNTVVESTTTVKNVHDFVEMPGTGRVYRGTISVSQLGKLIKKGTLKYAPGYQRGFKGVRENPADYEPLQPLTNPALQVKLKRAEEMAVKYLDGKLFSAGVIWNARKEEGEPGPEWDPETHELSIYTEITVPDTAHRHLNYYLLERWKRDPAQIPVSVIVNEMPVYKEKILDLLNRFDPNNSLVFLEIYNLSPVHEGHLYDQFNNDAKKPDRAVGIQLNRQKTPSRRFVDALMNASPIFSEFEVETRSNTIGSDSRKLTTISTLVAAAEQPSLKNLLVQLESDDKNASVHSDLVLFFNEFFTEYAKVFPVFQPSTPAEDRQKARSTDGSFALSNIIFFPLFRMARDLWIHYREHKLDWRTQDDWKKAIAKLDGQVAGENGDGKVSVMSRSNPSWRGKVLVETYGPSGVTGYSLSSTRQTRDAAYQYLLEVSGLTTLVSTDTKAK
jgi:hypothetical protein